MFLEGLQNCGEAYLLSLTINRRPHGLEKQRAEPAQMPHMASFALFWPGLPGMGQRIPNLLKIPDIKDRDPALFFLAYNSIAGVNITVYVNGKEIFKLGA